MVLINSAIVQPLVLEYAKDRRVHTLPELYNYISEKCGLTENQKQIMDKSQIEPVYKHNIRNGMMRLFRSGYIKNERAGKFSITDKGLLECKKIKKQKRA